MARYELFNTTLIGEMKKHEVIYNIAHPDRVDLSKRHNAWAEISKSLDENVLQCKARWAGLRVKYKLELSKMTDPNYTSRWKFIEQMDFMKEFVDPNSNKNFLQKLAIMSKRDLFCRACLCPIVKNSEQNSKSYNIFNAEDIVEKLIQCTNLTIEVSDKYPHSLCERCYKKMIDFYKFQCMCRDSLEKFNIMLENDLATNMNKDENEIPENVGHNLTEYDDTFELKTVQMDTNNTNVRVFNEIYADMNKNNDNKHEEHISEVDPLTENEDLVHIVENYLKEENNYKLESDVNSPKNENINHTCNENVETIIKLEETSIAETANTDTSEIIKEEEQSSQDEEYGDDTDDEQSEEISDDNNSLLDVLKTTNKRCPLKCDICSQSFLYQHRLEAHLRRHQGLAGYPCTYGNCERAFNRLTDLRQHLDHHNGIKKEYTCDIDNCKKVYGCSKSLYEHKRAHHNIGKPKEKKKYECEICNAILTNARSMKGHHYTHMDKSQWPFVCNVDGCEMRFRMKHQMTKHLKRHTGIKDYVCPHCGARKTTSTELSIHINVHTFEKKYPCSLCPKVLKSSGARSTHIHTVHEGMKLKRTKIDQRIDCPCQFCGRVLASPKSLRVHTRIHTGEKPYECKICGMRFSSLPGRDSHIRIHSDEKKYKCDECEKSFRKLDNLKIHKKLHVEGTIPYSCDQCGQGFRWPGAMYAHKKKHHTKQNEDNIIEEVN